MEIGTVPFSKFEKESECMKVGFLFPGQGAQYVGMCKDFYEKYDKVKDTYEKVEEITGVDIANISFNGDESVLNETKNTQLAVLTMSLAILELLKENGIEADVLAGLSLGEYVALIHSKVLSLEDGVKVVQKRGEFMQNLLPAGEWQMAAIIGLDDEVVESVCNSITSGFVFPANYNTKGQVVISGEKIAVEEASVLAKEKGAKLVNVIKTAGPFHTVKLTESAKALREVLEKTTFNNFETTVIKNIDGEKYGAEDDVREILEKHIISHVRFSKTLQTMLDMGIDTFVEVGPGKTLSGFVKRIKTDKEIKILNINSVKTFEDTLAKLKGDA